MEKGLFLSAVMQFTQDGWLQILTQIMEKNEIIISVFSTSFTNNNKYIHIFKKHLFTSKNQ